MKVFNDLIVEIEAKDVDRLFTLMVLLLFVVTSHDVNVLLPQHPNLK